MERLATFQTYAADLPPTIPLDARQIGDGVPAQPLRHFADGAGHLPQRSGGHLQPLCALWDTAALHRALRDFGDVSDRPAKALLESVSFVSVEGTGEERDYDTLEELAEFGDVED